MPTLLVLRDFRDLPLMKIPTEILPPLSELLSGNKGFESFSSVDFKYQENDSISNKSSRDFKQ